MSPRQHSLLVETAVRAVGSEHRLCALLGVSWSDLHGWLDARTPVPSGVFLRLLDVLERRRTTAPAGEEPQHRLLDPAFAPADREEILECALDAATTAAATDLGNVQLLDESGTLRIAAQRGFGPEFLQFFAAVKDPESACGVALILVRQYCVPDVQSHAIFRGTPAGAVLLAAGVRAVESTPIVGTSGTPLGMLSVHHRAPGTPEDAVMAQLARIARRAGAFLEAQAAR